MAEHAATVGGLRDIVVGSEDERALDAHLKDTLADVGYAGVEVVPLYTHREAWGSDSIIRARRLEALEGTRLCRIRALAEFVRLNFAFPHAVEVFGEQA